MPVRPAGTGGRSEAEPQPPTSLPNQGARGRDSGACLAPACAGPRLAGRYRGQAAPCPAFALLLLTSARAGSICGAGSRGKSCSSTGNRGKDGSVPKADLRSPQGSAFNVSLEGRKSWKRAREEGSVAPPGRRGLAALPGLFLWSGSLANRLCSRGFGAAGGSSK